MAYYVHVKYTYTLTSREMQLQYWAQRVTGNAFGALNLERLKTSCYCMFIPTLSNLLQQSTVFLLAIVL